MKPSYYVGVSFLKGKIQLAEIEHSKKPTVIALAERDTTLNFAEAGASLSADHPKLGSFARELKDLLRQQKVTAEYISFALPPELVFINIIPIDASLSDQDLPRYLQWEVDQYFPGAPPKEFIIDSHGLPVEKAKAQQTFMVAVHRGMAAFLQKTVAAINMKLNIVDVDQFSTEKTLITNYPEILDHDIVLFGLREGGVDASLIHSGEMTDYRSFRYNGESRPEKPILNYLKYLKQRGSSAPAAMLLHGIEVGKDLVESLRTSTGIKQTLPLNAFRKVMAAEKLYKPFVQESYRFAAAIGLALRTK